MTPRPCLQQLLLKISSLPQRIYLILHLRADLAVGCSISYRRGIAFLHLMGAPTIRPLLLPATMQRHIQIPLCPMASCLEVMVLLRLR